MSTDGQGRLEGPPAPLALVERQLRRSEGYLLEVVQSDYPFVSVLAQHLLRAGGKRLRVALTFLAAGFGSGAREDDVTRLAVAIELTHLATLHHDDIIDEADSRRGVPSVNASWTNTLAVLSGDYLFAKSSQLAAEVGGEIPAALAAAIAALCEGQIIEIESAFRLDRSPDDYLRVIERKTARLIATASYLGATAGGAEPGIARALERFGSSFGMALQVADDVLDFLGDEVETGKAVGADLREGVYTLPVLHALGQSPNVAELVRSDGDLTGVVNALHEAGSFRYARSVAERFAAEAREEALRLPDIPERAALEGLVEFVLGRMPVSSAA